MSPSKQFILVLSWTLTLRNVKGAMEVLTLADDQLSVFNLLLTFLITMETIRVFLVFLHRVMCDLSGLFMFFQQYLHCILLILWHGTIYQNKTWHSNVNFALVCQKNKDINLNGFTSKSTTGGELYVQTKTK